MRLVAFKRDGGHPGLGHRIDDEIVDLTALGFPATLSGLLRQGAEGLAAARTAAARAPTRMALSALAYLPPVVDPGKAIAS